MAVWSVISKKALEKNLRLDSEYYQPEYLFNENIINKITNDNIGNISFNISYGTTPMGGEFVEDSRNSIPFIRSQNFSLLSINTDRIVYCDKNHHIKNKKSTIYPQDILFAAVGATIGQLAMVQNEIREGNINQNIARVRIKDKRFSSSYIAFFFYSKYGQNQINRYITGNAQFYLNSTQIASFKVPVLKDTKLFDDYLNKIQDLIFQSKSLYFQAEQILLEELGLKDLDLKDDLFYTTTLNEVKENNRMDAEYYITKYNKLIAYIRNYKNGYCRLLDIVQNVTTNYDPLKEGEHFRYIELSNIQASIGIIENAIRLRTADAPSRAKRKLKKGDVIVSSIKGSLDKTAMVVSDFDGAFASNGFFQFRSKLVNPAYLTMLIKSDIVYLQLFREASGAILSAVTKESLKNIIIPKLGKNIQEEISKFVQNAHDKYHEAKQLLEEAKHEVEEMIEKEVGVK